MQASNPQSAHNGPAVLPWDSIHSLAGNASVLNDGVPALESSVKHLRRLAGARVLDLAELVDVMESDFALAANTLRLAARHAAGVESIEEAVVLLGREGLGEVAARTPMLRPSRDEAALWEHSSATARRCAILLRDAPEAVRRRGKLAGLLHDLGRVVTRGVEDDPEQLAGGLHCTVGAYLAGKWTFPDFVRDTMRFHHQRGYDGDHAEIVRVVQTADRLSIAARRNWRT
ncbi:MAG TPA: HDOD domain-containing protein [Clostridia bacterium]|nr:HDOD domain-containing protein [Clostridia bacterium]